METLKKRADFLRAAKGVRRVEGAITLEICQSPDAAAGSPWRVGFTASRKVGNAVARNLAKRRLRAAASQLLPLLGRGGHDYVLVARASTGTLAFDALLADVTAALKGAHQKLDRMTGEGI
jgi:ribonuclease P protein component